MAHSKIGRDSGGQFNEAIDKSSIDCEQSLFFAKVREVNARDLRALIISKLANRRFSVAATNEQY